MDGDGTGAGVADPPIDEVDADFDDDRLTAMGLLTETFTAIQAAVEADLRRGGLTGSTFEVMIRLCRSPDRRLRMTELAAQSTLTSSGLTRVVDRLEQQGLVVREPCPEDRRGFWARITDEGIARMRAILPGHLDAVDRAFTGTLEPRDLDQMLRSLRAIRAVVRPSADPVVAARIAEA